ncbi:hypothetical protein TrRE_jg11596, partial [Triparma retinervis]
MAPVPNSSLSPDELKARKEAKKKAKAEAKVIKARRQAEFRKAMSTQTKPPPPSLYIFDNVRVNAERLVQVVSTALFASAFSSSSEDREARERGGELMKLMTANKFKLEDMEDPIALWGYTRHKFSKRALLTFDSLRLLEKTGALPTFFPS